MSLFSPYSFNLAQAEVELDSLESWLTTTGFVSETAVLEKIKERPHLLCLLGPTGRIAAPNLVKWELNLQGIYRADLAIGNDNQRGFLLVEFEGAEEFSLFGKKGTIQNRDWSNQLEHGFGQVVDWACLLSEHKQGSLIQNNFGGPIQSCAFLVICGRDKGITGPLEKARLNYRREYVRIEGISSQVLTYDEMISSMRDNLELWKTSP